MIGPKTCEQAFPVPAFVLLPLAALLFFTSLCPRGPLLIRSSTFRPSWIRTCSLSKATIISSRPYPALSDGGVRRAGYLVRAGRVGVDTSKPAARAMAGVRVRGPDSHFIVVR
ncbi:hypothetical protein B0H11DRAFT_2077721 [Mycena galericulata]|nr:hypothetical protein B0H11DRAFT_2077721 [Mycena galericulata]